jgi:hypothetical protein
MDYTPLVDPGRCEVHPKVSRERRVVAIRSFFEYRTGWFFGPFKLEELIMTVFRTWTAGGIFMATLLATTCIDGQTIPEAARKSMGQLVAVWEIEELVDGEMSKGEIDTKWNRDKTAVIYSGRGSDRLTKKPVTWTGLIGWDGKRKVLVEYSVASNGELYNSTVDISKENWRSPTKGTLLIEGQYVRFKTLRTFKWKSPDEFIIIGTSKSVDGESVPDTTATFRRVR